MFETENQTRRVGSLEYHDSDQQRFDPRLDLCKHCGGVAYIQPSVFSNLESGRVICSQCHISTPYEPIFGNESNKASLDRLIGKWNRKHIEAKKCPHCGFEISDI